MRKSFAYGRLAMPLALALVGLITAAAADAWVPLAGSPVMTASRSGQLSLAWTAADIGRDFYAGSRLVMTSSGSPESGFSPPAQLSEPGDAAYLRDVAANSNGDAIAVWTADRYYDQSATCSTKYEAGLCPFGVPRGTWYSLRLGAASWSAPSMVAPPPSSAVLAAINARGDIAVAYVSRGAVFLRQGTATTRLGTPVQLSPAAGLSYIGMDGAGEVLVVMPRSDGAIDVRLVAADGRMAPIQTLTKPNAPTGSPYAAFPVAAMGPAGQAIVAWTAATPGAEIVRAAYRPAHGGFLAAQTLPSGTTPAQATVDARGDATLISETRNPTGGGTDLVISRSGSDGVLSAPVQLASMGQVAGTPREDFTSDGVGDSAVTYASQPSAGGPVSLEMQMSISGAAFSAPQTLASAPESVPTWPQTYEWPARSAEVPAVAVQAGPLIAAAWIGPASNESLLVQTWTNAGSSPVTTIPLSTPAPEPAFAPSSFLDLGATARPDHRHRIAGQLSCGSDPPLPCKVAVTVEQAGRTHRVLASAAFVIPPVQTRRIAIHLDAVAQRLMVRRRRLSAQVITSTSTGHAASTVTAYPVTLIR